MDEVLKNKKCPSCTAPLRYDAKSGKLKCDFCGESYAVEELEGVHEEVDDIRGEKLGRTWENDEMSVYSCPSCGAELVTENTTSALVCPYCGSSEIITKRLSGQLRPDVVLPFTLSREDAEKAFSKQMEGKFLLPKAFKDKSHIKEVKGLYVPFFLTGVDTETDAYYNGEISEEHREGKYLVTKTYHYLIHRHAVIPFEMIPSDASEKMGDEAMQSLEPFDFSTLKDFNESYLAGFYADARDTGEDDSIQNALQRSAYTSMRKIRSTIKGYENVRLKDKRTAYRNVRIKYALLPVWTLFTEYRGEKFLFMVNGQSGKFVGNFPVDKRKLFALRLTTFLISCCAIFALLFYR